MPADFLPLRRERLTDTLAERIGALIRAGQFLPGDRLPPIGEMARALGVGAPTVRQALTKLETLGIVEVRHGLGVFVRSAGQRVERILMTERAAAGDRSGSRLLRLD